MGTVKYPYFTEKENFNTRTFPFINFSTKLNK